MNLPRFSLRFPVTACMVIVSALVLGGVSARRLPLAFLPEVDFPALEVQIPYPNALPAQVEEEITRPAEEALATLSRVRRIRSWSSADAANISIEFDWGEDIEPLRVEAREKLDRIRDKLPVDVDRIQVNSFRSSDIPILECRVSAERDLSKSYELLNRNVADRLRRVPGVAKVELYGVEPPEVQIDFRMDAIRRHGLDAGSLLDRLNSANRSLSAGVIRRGRETWSLRVVNQFASLEEIADYPVNSTGLRLSDVATIQYREPELDYGRHLDHARAIGLNVIKESGANTVAVVGRARQALREMEDDPLLEGIQVLTFTDQAEEITNSLEGLLSAGLAGALLATFVLYFFLRRLAATLVVATAIPVSVLAACAILYFTGRSLNILSMMGLMLAIGMLVDNAVVVLESIDRHRRRGMSRLHAALSGSREVLPAVICSTATSIIVFLPLVLGGRTEITTWIGEVGRTIIITLLCSLLLSLTAIPLAMGRFLPAGQPPRSRLLDSLASRYGRILAWTLDHRPATLGIAFLVVATAVFPFMKIDKSTFTGTRVESVHMTYEFADNLNHQEVERYVTFVEEWIHARKDSVHAKSTYSFYTNNYAFTRVYLAPGYASDEGAKTVRDILRAGIPPLPGLELKHGDDDNSGPSRLSVNLFGDPGPRLESLGEEVERRLSLVPGLTDVEVGGEKGKEEVEVVVQRDRATRYGLTTSEVAAAVALFFRGRPLARYRGPEGEVEVRARLAPEDRESLVRLGQLPLRTADGSFVPLASLADFRTVETPSSIQRQGRRSVMSVSGNYVASRGSETRKAATKEMEAMSFPVGYSWSYGSDFQEENATQTEMLINLVMALLLVYLVMAGLFESLLHPFAIMLALPFAFVGVSWICFLTDSPFNLMAQIGLLILVGIVVNNGIVLIHHVHQLMGRGVERRTALLDAARSRLRPILMTTLTTILGLLPLAVGQNDVGDLLYFPLARTVIGGLAASTLLTLILVPCLYTLLEDGTRLVGRVWAVGPRRA